MIDKKGRRKHKPELYDRSFRKQWIETFDALNVPLFVSAHEHFYTRYFSSALARAQYATEEPKVTTYFNTSTFGGPFVEEGAERAVLYGRLNDEKQKPSSFAETEMSKENGKLLKVSLEPTYSVISLTQDAIEVVTKKFDNNGKNWKEFDKIVMRRPAERWKRVTK